LLHSIWLELSEKGLGHKLHHRDVVRVALQRLRNDLQSRKEKEVLHNIKQEASDGRKIRSGQGYSPEEYSPPDPPAK
jgi:hypothetical protein